MNKMLITAAATVALLMAPGTANAQTFKLGPPTGTSTGGATGQWDATATNTGGNTWHIRVVATPGNNPVAGGNPTAFFANQVKIAWLGCPPFTAAQSVTAGASVGHGTYDNPDIAGVSPTVGPWVVAYANAGNEASTDYTHTTGNGLLFDGTNQFETTVTLNDPVGEIQIDVTDGAGIGGPNNWGGTLAICTPEPATMILAGAGLAPLMGLLKRRRRSSDEEEAEEIA